MNSKRTKINQTSSTFKCKNFSSPTALERVVHLNRVLEGMFFEYTLKMEDTPLS